MSLSSVNVTAGAAEGSSILTPTSGDLSLYFHIPFCTKKCDYCHFFVLPNKVEEHHKFIEALKLEWNLRASLCAQKSIKSIYFGGGTPSLLAPDQIKEILSWIPYLPGTEITLEANPENLTPTLLQGFYQAGINRLSIGAQTFDDTLLKAIGRTHDSQATLSALEAATQAGFKNITIDLMYDLPGQTYETWEKTLHIAAQQPITHLSLYNLTIEPETVFFKKRHELKKTIPDPETSLQMYKSAQHILADAGLHQYEISAFAKKGFHSIHNTGYWTARPFIGFGPSAYSFIDGTRQRNIPHFGKYQKALLENQDPVDEKDNLSPEERIKELLAVEIRLCRGVNLTEFQQRHGELSQETLNSLKLLEKNGWLTHEDSKVKMTPQGILFYDSLAEELI